MNSELEIQLFHEIEVFFTIFMQQEALSKNNLIEYLTNFNQNLQCQVLESLLQSLELINRNISENLKLWGDF